jgi:hypothetical protein
MNSFQKLWEFSKPGRDFWDQGSDNFSDKETDLVLRGLEIRPDREDGKTFWDDFILLFGNNTDAASKLLEVSPDKISQWSSKIKKALDQSRSKDKEKERATMIQTGEQ